MSRPDASDGGIRFGSVEGSSVVIGDNNKVTNTHQPAPEPPAAHAELLQAVRELREAIAAARASGEEPDAELDAELAATEDEIKETGRAGEGRLARLRQALSDVDALTGAAASTTAVVQALTQLGG